MKLKDGVIISQVENEYVAVFAGEAGKACSGMMRMNKVSAFIMERLQQETDEAQLVAALLERYEVSEEDARKSVLFVIDQVNKAGIMA
ncbi:MAG: PqqD family protein [Clostridia bacterium]|nr:PqqD family protein [Clostridia bacterium]